MLPAQAIHVGHTIESKHNASDVKHVLSVAPAIIGVG